MKLLVAPVAMLAGAAISHLAIPAAAPAVAAVAVAPAAPPPVAIDDARRAAAQRVLSASRFRARQQVLLDDSIRAAQADLVSDCVTRAGEGRSLAGCDATGRDPGTSARLTAVRPAMLDEIMVASQTVYARNFTVAEMDEITRFFMTPVGRKYGEAYPRIISDVQARKRTIIGKYLIAAARPPAPARPRQ